MARPLLLSPILFALLGISACTQSLGTAHTPPVTVPEATASPAKTTAALPAASSGCDHPFGLYDNAELVYDLTDGDGKKAGQLIQRVVRLGTETNKKQTHTTTTVLLKSGLYDAKSKLLRLHDLTFACQRDTAFTDGMDELGSDALNSFRGRIFHYIPTHLAWPNNPTIGTTLPNGGVVVEISSTAVDIAQVSATQKNRRVVGGPETVTTPAGAFQCYKVESEYETGTVAHVDIVVRKTAHEVTYYSPAVGIVRTECYAKNKLVRVQVLAARRGMPQ